MIAAAPPSSGWVAIVAALIVSAGGGAGWIAFRTIKGTKAQLMAGAYKLKQEGDNFAVDSLQDALKVYIDEFERCKTERAENRQQLDEAYGIVSTQGALLATAHAKIAEQAGQIQDLQHQVASLERRRDWTDETGRRGEAG